jgi:hypothetical protein
MMSTIHNRNRGIGNRMRRMFFTIVICLVVAWVVWLGLILLFQETFVFPRFIANRDVPASAPADVEILRIALDDGGFVESWLLPPIGTTPAPLLVIAHGNAERIDSWIDFARRQQQRGYAVLLPEYRGYGLSGGSPTQQDLVDDTIRFVDQVHARNDVDADRTGYLGMSIGTAVLAQVALERAPRGIVMLVPPARIDSFLWRFAAPSFLMRHPFRTDLAVQQLDLPILICSNTRDHIIPHDHGRRLDELAIDSTYMEFDGDHNVLHSDAEVLRRRRAMDGFLDGLLEPGR